MANKKTGRKRKTDNAKGAEWIEALDQIVEIVRAVAKPDPSDPTWSVWKVLAQYVGFGQSRWNVFAKVGFGEKQRVQVAYNVWNNCGADVWELLKLKRPSPLAGPNDASIASRLPQAIGVYHLGQQRYDWLNDTFGQMVGLSGNDVGSEKAFMAVLPAGEADKVRAYTSGLEHYPADHTTAGIDFQLADGRWLGRRDTIRETENNGGIYTMVQVADITEKVKRDEGALQILSMLRSQDHLTFGHERLVEVERVLAGLYRLLKQEEELVVEQRRGLTDLFGQFRLVHDEKSRQIGEVKDKADKLGLK